MYVHKKNYIQILKEVHKVGIRERKEREKDFRRRQIQDSAKKMFLLNGFRSTTMEEIANEAELSVGAIYQYFKSKDELYASMNLESLRHMTIQVESIYKDQRLTPKEKILKIKDVMFNHFLSDPPLVRVIFHVQLEDTLSTLNGELLKQLNETGREMMRLITAILEEGTSAGKFINGKGIVHADIIWGIFAGLTIWEGAKKKVNPEKDFFKSTLDRAFEIFCRGIEKDNNKRLPESTNIVKEVV
jgi:AcrR family transcriptional regulator